MAVRFFSKSTIAQGLPRSTKVWDQVAALNFSLQYLVVGGGGGGGSGGAGVAGGGGGAGGYLTSNLTYTFESSLTVTVGAGGGSNAAGANSVFASITALGGGQGGCFGVGANGGSGGGTTGDGPGFGSGTAGQGNNGAIGRGTVGGSSCSGGGGGGAGGAGTRPVNNTSTGAGGIGLSNSITGTAVTYAVGGNGAQGSTGPAQPAGATNTGGGGGGGAPGGGSASSGGSGIVILSYPSIYTITVGAGLTASTATVGSNKVTSFTAGTGTVSFA